MVKTPEIGLEELLHSESPFLTKESQKPLPRFSRYWFPGAIFVPEYSVYVRPQGGGLDAKISALTAATSGLDADEFPINEAGTTKKLTLTLLRQYVGSGLSNGSVAAVSAAYAADTYLTGSAITIPVAGGWRVKTQIRWTFDMVKTAAGTATFIIQIRMGTLGTTGDASILTLTFAIGTGAIDTGLFDVIAIFRTIGSGTAAVIQGIATLVHHLAATGLTTTGAAGTAIILGTSAGFNSTTQTVAGLSINGGASFSGTNTVVRAIADNI